MSGAVARMLIRVWLFSLLVAGTSHPVNAAEFFLFYPGQCHLPNRSHHRSQCVTGITHNISASVKNRVANIEFDFIYLRK